MSAKKNCKILSLNARGIRDSIKRRGIFSYLKDQKASFYFLQETYSEILDENIWKNEWGGEIIFSHGSNHSRGVCILIHPSTKINIEYSFKDKSGRLVLTTLEFNCLKLSLCNIYAPNNLTDPLQFIQELTNCLIDKSELTTLIVGGDWNCTLSKKDKKGGAVWKPTSFRNAVLTMMDVFDLIDIQRDRYPNLNKYSYFSKSLGVKSRIDFLLIAKNLKSYVRKADIEPSIAPDHRTVYLSLSLPESSRRGPGFWKFNNSLLDDDEYLDMVRGLYPLLREKLNDIQDKRITWELLKMEIRSATISFAKRKASITNRREIEIKELLQELDDTICNSDNLQNVERELKLFDNLKKELEVIYEHKGRAAMFRSKCRWIEQGERPTKCFFNLEKTNYNKKVIAEIETENGEYITDENQILSEIETYYHNLYSSQSTATLSEFRQFTQNIDIPHITEDIRAKLEGRLTYEECKKVLSSFSNGKSPGEDGFTAEFYAKFFDILGEDLVESLNSAHEKGQLSISQRRRVITLLPKDDTALSHLKNWRPITLLNVDYKIASKAIAKRIEATLPHLIHTDQTGFIKGRYISENIRLISDLMEQTKIDKTPGISLAIDFRKAFDTLEWPLIYYALETYNFGESLRRWIEVFFTDVESTVLNNGFASNWIKPSRGVRQGCPLSPFLFILTAELMSNKIRQSDSVKGVSLCGNEVKLSQFADDTNLFCADLLSVQSALQTLEEFGKISGLNLNKEKTKAIWLGTWANKREKPLGLKWVNCARFLGIYLSYDKKGNDFQNFDLKVQKLQTNQEIWRARDLTLFGRVLIIKSLGLSQLFFRHPTLTFPIISPQLLKRGYLDFYGRVKEIKLKGWVFIRITPREDYA